MQKESGKAQETQIHSLSAGKVKAIMLTSFTLYPRLIHAVSLILCQLSLAGMLSKIKSQIGKLNGKVVTQSKRREANN